MTCPTFTAKRAYLALLLNPPPSLPYPALIRPYEGPDSAAIIHSVNARSHGHGHRSSFSNQNGQNPARASFSQTGGQPFNGFANLGPTPRHGRSASLSSTGNVERPNFSGSTGESSASNAFNKLGAGGAFSGFGANMGSSSSAHTRQASGGSGSGSWGRTAANPISSVPVPSIRQTTGFNPGRLATHHEMDSPQTTPVKAGVSTHQPTNSASSNPGRQDGASHPHLGVPKEGTHADLSSPGLDILGAVGPEGGPGGSSSASSR